MNNKKFKEELACLREECEGLKVEAIKAEAYREFAERLKSKMAQGFWAESLYLGAGDIDHVLQEMIGGKDGS